MDWQHFLLSFQGRISRRQYLLYSLLPLTIAGFIIGLLPLLDIFSATPGALGLGSSLAIFLSIPLIWISVATTVKRWHDRGKSGLMYLVNFIPLIGGLWTLYECGALPGDEGENRYGLDPRMFDTTQMAYLSQIQDVTDQVDFDDEDMMAFNTEGDVVDFDDATFKDDLLDDFDNDLDTDLNTTFENDFAPEVPETFEGFEDDGFDKVTYVETGDAVLFEEEGADPLNEDLRSNKEESW